MWSGNHSLRNAVLNHSSSVHTEQCFRFIARHSYPKDYLLGYNLFLPFRLGGPNFNTLKNYQSSCLILFSCISESKKVAEISSINKNTRFRIQVMYNRPCYYTAYTIFRNEKAFTFLQNLNIINSTECQTVIKTNFKFHMKYKPQILH